MMRKFIDFVPFAFCSLALTGCPDDKSAEEGTGPASGETGEQAAGETSGEPTPARPEAMPLLCTLDGGKWCPAPCPSGDAGPLCCSDACAPWSNDGQPCGGAVGWCSNYTTSTTLSGSKISTCHDEP